MSIVQANQKQSYPKSGFVGLQALRNINPHARPGVPLVAWPLHRSRMAYCHHAGPYDQLGLLRETHV